MHWIGATYSVPRNQHNSRWTTLGESSARIAIRILDQLFRRQTLVNPSEPKWWTSKFEKGCWTSCSNGLFSLKPLQSSRNRKKLRNCWKRSLPNAIKVMHLFADEQWRTMDVLRVKQRTTLARPLCSSAIVMLSHAKCRRTWYAHYEYEDHNRASVELEIDVRLATSDENLKFRMVDWWTVGANGKMDGVGGNSRNCGGGFLYSEAYELHMQWAYREHSESTERSYRGQVENTHRANRSSVTELSWACSACSLEGLELQRANESLKGVPSPAWPPRQRDWSTVLIRWF